MQLRVEQPGYANKSYKTLPPCPPPHWQDQTIFHLLIVPINITLQSSLVKNRSTPVGLDPGRRPRVLSGSPAAQNLLGKGLKLLHQAPFRYSFSEALSPPHGSFRMGEPVCERRRGDAMLRLSTLGAVLLLSLLSVRLLASEEPVPERTAFRQEDGLAQACRAGANP